MPETGRQCSKRAVMPKTSFGGSCTLVEVENSQWKIWCRVGPERLLLMGGLLLELNGWGGAGSGEVDRAVGWALCRHKTVNTSRNCTTVKASTKLWTGHVSQLPRTTSSPALVHDDQPAGKRRDFLCHYRIVLFNKLLCTCLTPAAQRTHNVFAILVETIAQLK